MTKIERDIKRETGYGDVVRDPKKKRTKRDGFKAAVKYADGWFAKYIILRDKRCVTCGSTVDLQCSHIFRRHSYATRWAVDNAAAQCKKCHFLHHTKSEYPLQSYALKRIGQDAMDELWLRSKTVSKFSADTIKAFGDSFREQCKEMSHDSR